MLEFFGFFPTWLHPNASAFFWYQGLGYFLGAAVLSFILVAVCRKIALHFNIVDQPSSRKIHHTPIPLLAGLGIILAFILILSLALIFKQDLGLALKPILGLIGALVLIAIAGLIDDTTESVWWWQLIFVALAATIIFNTGVRIEGLTHPLGGLLVLPEYLGLILTIFWFWAVVFTTKVLDGLDGLVGSITLSGALVITILTLSERWWQPGLGSVSLMVAGVFCGYLIWNWPPAKIYQGQAGSLAAGFLLAWLSVVSGSKLLTALLVLLLPVIDLFWTITRRLLTGRTWRAIFIADKKHLHHVLLRRQWSVQTIVVFYLLIGLIPGIISIFLSPLAKLIFLTLLIFSLIIFVAKMYSADDIH